jgi:NADPH-dependent 2,4-dienoyl-CoA reductase/sulfur reductase-like enzyme
MVCETNVPIERVFGYDVGSMLLTEHERNGAKVYNNRDVTKIKYTGDNNGNVKSVVLDNGYEIKADLVIIGAGIILNTELAKNAGLKIDANGGVSTNPFM